MNNELGLIREFKIGRQFRVVVDAFAEDSPDFSWDTSGETERDVAAGKLVAFMVRVRVIHRDLGELSADYLGNCIAQSIDSFMDLAEVGTNRRKLLRQPGQENTDCGSEFRDMVRQAIADARGRLIELRAAALSVRVREVRS